MSSLHRRLQSFEEVRKHNKDDDCWIIVRGKVYDVTKFMDEHPGGGQVLVSATGKDATQDFEEIGHSEFVKELMAEYYIGEIYDDVSTSTYTYVDDDVPLLSPKHDLLINDCSDVFGTKILPSIVALFVLGLGLVTTHFYYINDI